jgi:hypothetical protein
LPDELLAKIPSAGTTETGELEVEWQEWDGVKK